MKLISVWATKGGVGKTTLAIHIAAGLAANGYRVMVCDCDLQQSVVSYGKYAEMKGIKLPFKIHAGGPKQKPEDIDVIIVDHAPSDEKPSGGIIVMAYCPGPLEFWALHGQKEMTQGRMVVSVLNRVNRTRSDDQAAMASNIYGDNTVVIHERSVYRRVIGRGSTVFDASVIDHLYGAREAKKEMDVLIREIESRFGTIKNIKNKVKG